MKYNSRLRFAPVDISDTNARATFVIETFKFVMWFIFSQVHYYNGTLLRKILPEPHSNRKCIHIFRYNIALSKISKYYDAIAMLSYGSPGLQF